MMPQQWKVLQHVREKLTCRHCETISEPPAPFHVIPRGIAGIADHPAQKLDQLLPWHWNGGSLPKAA